ncbi:MAG TPA: hypothetical protein VIQ29_25065 [Ancylobacter sp.]
MHQFLSVQGYSVEGAHKKNSRHRKPAIRDIIAELVRAPHACPHVASPQPPLVLYGCVPNIIPELASDLVSKARSRAGHKLRCDSPVALFGVTSWPVPRADVDLDPILQEKYLAWRADVIDYLKMTWGDELICIVEHVDETFPHLHFCVLPKLPPDLCLTIAAVHPGHRAAMQASKADESRKQQKRAYNTAMVGLQDGYYLAIGARHGLARLGPRRQRLLRKEWLDQQRQAEALATAYKRVQDLGAAAKQQSADLKLILTEDAERKVASAEAAAEERVASFKRRAEGYIVHVGKRRQQIENELQAKDRIIAQQIEENAALMRILAEHGISLGPTM